MTNYERIKAIKQDRNVLRRLSAIFTVQKTRVFRFGRANGMLMLMIEVTICLIYAATVRL